MPMDNPTLYKLMIELRQQCQFSQMAWKEIKSRLNGLDPERVFFYVHAYLKHLDIVSRFLWPERKDSRERGEALRKALNVPNESPLKLGPLREQLEREDERFEDWVGSLAHPDFVDINLMPMAAIVDFKADSFHRSLDSDTFKLHLRGVACDLKPVGNALRQLEISLQSWLKTHNPW